MRRFFNLSIRQRLWMAFALLAMATLFAGAIGWTALSRANTRLDELHRQTLAEVARSLNLSKQSADLATSAPFLLSLNSPYLIEREGQRLLLALDPVLAEWPVSSTAAAAPVYSFEAEIRNAVLQMKSAVSDLMASANLLSRERDATRVINVQLARLERQFYARSTNPESANSERRVWLALLTMTNNLVGAGHAQNLLGVGEHRRKFQSTSREFLALPDAHLYAANFSQLNATAFGHDGLFEVRRRELSQRLASQNALFHIRFNANIISSLAAQFAGNAEIYLSQERQKTTTSISFAKATILIAGLASVALALISALFVSNYVTGNIHAISDAMMRLAQGDRRAQLTKKPQSDDEIGKLLQSFRIFRANALRLDRSNRQLNLRNAQFEKIFANISDGVAITNASGQVTAENPNLLGVLKLEPAAIGEKSEIEHLLRQTIFTETITATDIHAGFRGFAEVQSPDGQVLEVRCSRLPDGGGIWLFSDATERRKMQERLRQIEQIESLGKITGEVAHDFGNILSTISANAHLLETNSGKTDNKALLQGISNAVEIGASLTERLLAFARKQRLAPEVVELNELVEGLSDLVSIGLHDGVELKVALSDSKLYVRVDPGQLESAILNLCLNGAQAIEGVGQVTITVHENASSTAIIEISDTGCGMSDAVLNRSLEPFFSARSDGEGTGLGLSMVYGFIKQTGGEIHISSDLTNGTQVRLELPLCREDTAHGDGVSGDKPIVLLVEDDLATLEAVGEILVGLGYDLRRASSFQAAQAALADAPELYALVTDLHLDRGHSGWALVRTCLDAFSETKIVVTSGRMPDVHPYSDGHEPRVSCVTKPLSPAKLRRAISPPKPIKAPKNQVRFNP